jgi:hypothetical protein
MIKFSCVKDVNPYFTKGKVYEGYENKHGELYATDDSNKNFNVGINANDEWFQEHFVIVR